MSKFRKVALTIAALAALAVGGAAFAQAQNAGTATQPPVHRNAGDVRTPGDPVDAPDAADQGTAGEQEDAAGDQAEEPSTENEAHVPGAEDGA
jgi:hypothetical protein